MDCSKATDQRTQSSMQTPLKAYKVVMVNNVLFAKVYTNHSYDYALYVYLTNTNKHRSRFCFGYNITWEIPIYP